ncbi:MAG: phosphotransferase [Syntrophobacteraceae bacterium]|jgi:hypothetical protein|nr:phosphotransferase [Syntrophobacteraceae bacterium]
MSGLTGPAAVSQRLLAAAAHVLGSSGEVAQVLPLAGDGSTRRFFRLRSGRWRAVGVSCPRLASAGMDENDSYLLIGKHLHRCGLPVPEFIWADPVEGLFLLEDLGDVHLQQLVNGRRTSAPMLYARVIRLLSRLHERAREGFRADYCFDAPLYEPGFVLRRELEYFRKAFLEGFLMMEESETEILQPDFERLAGRAGVSERSFVIHRDFQSRNLMACGGRLGLLDFQGMRFGPPTYDLASMLIDPYVSLPEALQEDLKAMYWRGNRGFLRQSRVEFERSYAAVRLCRNLQALAAYALLGGTRGKPQFFHYITPAWNRLGASLRMAGPEDYRALSRLLLGRRTRDLLRGRLSQVLRDKAC